MNYSNIDVRRQDRLLEESSARHLLRSGEYGVLSMVREDGTAYGIPVNYVWDGEESVYLHCAPAGEKLRCIAAQPQVSFCVVGPTQVDTQRFTTGYESIVLTCSAHTDLEAEERMKALRLLLAKYTPGNLSVGYTYAEKSFHRTAIIRLDIKCFSGKCKRVAG